LELLAERTRYDRGVVIAALGLLAYITYIIFSNIVDLEDLLEDLFSDIEFTKGGKQRKRESGLENKTDEEISNGARDTSLSQEERQRYIREEKARRLRNKQKRT
jgi:hypothetical protein